MYNVYFYSYLHVQILCGISIQWFVFQYFREFFLNCDGIFLNYNWTESKLANSYTLVKNHNQNVHNIYVGLDVWGRGCPGGGGFNSTYVIIVTLYIWLKYK